MRHIIIGTAGHVDHGKTALIKALTGFEGDSTEEERRRGITINLSFSSLKNSDTNIAFIDVPGHEKLIKNMISGAFGFDASLLAIDATEGIMPQTAEHIQILSLVGVSNIIIALTKSDLVDDSIVEKRKEELTKYIESFKRLKLIDILPTSIYDENSIEELRSALFALPEIKRREDGLFRYYIDRSFSISGAGAVVTGTVLDGEIKVGDKVTVAEYGKEIQIRNIQVHDQDCEIATASQRAALNLQSPKMALKKGLLLTRKGFLRGFHSIDIWVQSIAGHEIRHDTTVQFFIGTKQIEAKILLYGERESIEQGFAKLRFKEKTYLVFDEPFVLSLSGRVTAGGRVVNPIDDPIKKRLKLPLLKTLKDKNFKQAFQLLVSTHKRGFGLISSNQRFGLNHDEALIIAKELDDVFVDEKGLVVYPIQVMGELHDSILDIYIKNQYALLSAKSISLKTRWASESLVEHILQNMVKEDILKYENGVYKNANIVINDISTLILNNIYDILDSGGIMPDAPYNIYDSLDLDRKMGDDALKKLTKSRKVIRLAHNLFVSYESLSSLMSKLKQIIRNEGYVELANFKQHFPELSRKYLIAYLEYLDRQSGIKKDGNRRSM
ncbi:MAG: selenocysteine-specific translation elongation factor [Sulfurovum sp.]|nr:selenocysteine-specific translation elongation factor [Sulfurovum sp.]